MKTLGWLSIAVVSFSVYAADPAITRHAFTVIAHRGNHTRAHENTITALRHALEAGVDYAEIDVRRTSDDHYVLMHDSTVDRMTDGHGAVANLTLAELKALHVREPKRPEISPDRIATLDDALALVKSGLMLYLDFKAGDRTQVAKAIRDAGAERQVLVYDSAEAVAQWRRVLPNLRFIVSPLEGTKTSEALVAFAKRSTIDVLDGGWTEYTPEMVTAARKAGLQIWPDIQDGEENAEYYARVIAVGFTGAQTDHPEQFLAWLKQKSLR